MIRKLALASLITLGVSTSLHAYINVGSGNLGYGGSAMFDSGQGVVATGATYTECQTMLDNAIAYRETQWGWTVTEYNPCTKRGVIKEVRSK